jgi:hypothetical protein
LHTVSSFIIILLRKKHYAPEAHIRNHAHTYIHTYTHKHVRRHVHISPTYTRTGAAGTPTHSRNLCENLTSKNLNIWHVTSCSFVEKCKCLGGTCFRRWALCSLTESSQQVSLNTFVTDYLASYPPS